MHSRSHFTSTFRISPSLVVQSIRDLDEQLSDRAPRRDVNLGLRDALCRERVFFVNCELLVSALLGKTKDRYVKMPIFDPIQDLLGIGSKVLWVADECT
jgi:hypothetical protein